MVDILICKYISMDVADIISTIPTCENTETFPSKVSLFETLSFRGEVGAEVVLESSLAAVLGVVGVAALLSPLRYRVLLGPGRAEQSGSTLSSRSSYGEETFSLESLLLRVVTLLAKLFFKFRNEILATFLEAGGYKALKVILLTL